MECPPFFLLLGDFMKITRYSTMAAAILVLMQQSVYAEILEYHIAAAPLSQTIATIARKNGISLSTDPQLLLGKTAPKIQGKLSVDDALQTALTGSDLQLVKNAEGTIYSIQKMAAVPPPHAEPASQAIADENATVLNTITIRALGSITEKTGSYTTGAMSTGVKLPLSVRETPQTVTVVTNQKIKDKAYETLDQAIQDSPGVVATKNAGDARYNYYSRGLIIDNIQYDGVSNPVQYYARDSDGADDLVMYDRVEILRGASGLVTGAGNPSGAINLIRKRPLSDQETSLTVNASSWGNARTTLDHSTALNQDGSIKARVIGSFAAGQSYKDESYNKDGLFYGTIEAKLSDATTVNVGYSYQKQKIDGYDWGGLPAKTDGSFYNFSSSSFFGNDWQYLDRQQHTAFLDLEQLLGNSWKFKMTGRASWSKSEMAGSYGWYTGSNLYLYDRRFNYDNDVYSFDSNISGPIALFGRQHELVFGINGNQTDLNILNAMGHSRLVSDPLTWNTSTVAAYSDFTPYSTLRYRTAQIGGYAAARFSLTDALKLIIGSRVSWYDYKSDTTILSTGVKTTSPIKANAEFTPYLGLVYDLNDILSVYASYTSIFVPQYYFDRNGQLLDPITGTNTEIGFKGQFFDDRLNGTLAVFEVNRDNVASRIAGLSYCNPNIAACYEGVDGVQTRGVELELSGFITDHWRITGGYTYAISKYTEGASSGEKFSTGQYPEQLFKLFTTYTLPNERWTIGSGLRAQSQLIYSTTTMDMKQPAYAIVDVMAKYQLNPKTQIQLNINNIFNKEYYAGLSTSAGSGLFMGDPRNVKLTFKHTF